MSSLENYIKIYQISILAILILLAVFVCLWIHILIKFKKIQEEYNNLNIFAHNLPDRPNCGYIHFDLKDKKFFYSPTLRRMININYSPNSLEELKLYFEEGSFNFISNYFDNLMLSFADPYDDNQRNIVTAYNGTKYWLSYQRCENKDFRGFIIWFMRINPFTEYLNQLSSDITHYSREAEKILSLINNIKIPIWIRDQNLRIRYNNKTFTKLLSSSGGADFAYTLAKDARENNIAISEIDSFNIDGERRIFEICEIAENHQDYQVGYAIELTKVEHLKQQIKQHDSALYDFISSSSSAIAIYSSDMRIRMWNLAFLNLWGLDERFLDTHPTYGEILETLRQKRKLPEQANFVSFKKSQIELFKSLTTIHNEFFYLPEGKTIRVVATPHALGGLLFAYEDITDKLAMERSYNTLIAVQETTLDNLHESIAVFNTDGKLKLYNAIFSKMWKLKKEYLDSNPHFRELSKVTEHFYIEDADIQKFQDTLLYVYEKRMVSSYQLKLADDTIIERSFVPLPDGSVLVTDIDITDSAVLERSLRERNEALEEADKIKTAFLADVSYQFRSPLTSIVGFSEILLKKHLGEINESQADYLQYICNAANELTKLINDIIELASIDAGSIVLKKSEVNINLLLNNITNSLLHSLLEHGVQIYNILDIPVFVYGDELKLKQALYNIIRFIITISRKDQKIEAKLYAEGSVIYIQLSNKDVFLSNEEISKILDRFKIGPREYFQVNREFVRGIGLNITKKIIELHNGNIDIISSQEDGLIITITLNNEQA